MLFVYDIVGHVRNQSKETLISTHHPVTMYFNDQLMGKWYVVGSVPTMMDRTAHNATEEYEWADKSKGRIKVCWKKRFKATFVLEITVFKDR